MIKKTFVFFLTLFLVPISTGQNLNDFSGPTEKHVLVRGTAISLIPPAGFDLSGNFKGFQNPDDPTSMIMVVDIPGPFSEVSKGFTTEMMASRGMKLNEKKEVLVNAQKGYLIDLEQEANGMFFFKSVLIFGNEQSTTMINGIHLKDSTDVGIAIKASIQTVVVDTSMNVNPRKELDYDLNENAGRLKFINVMGNAMLFNRDGKTPTASADKAILITDKSLEKTEIVDKKSFCIARLKKYPEEYEVITDKGIHEIELDGLKGFELFARNAEKELYQVIVFGEEGGYFLMFGTHAPGSEEAGADIKNVVKTFKRK